MRWADLGPTPGRQRRASINWLSRLRSAIEPNPGEYHDVLVYSRLATDTVYGTHGMSGVLNSILPSKRVIAHVLFRDDQGRALLLKTSYKTDWELPGGIVEPGEPPRVGAEREVAEELSFPVSLTTPALVDWLPPYLGWSDAIEFIYDAGVLTPEQIGRLQIDGQEIVETHWVSEAELDERVTPLSARRISLLLQGFRGATEDGVPVGSST